MPEPGHTVQLTIDSRFQKAVDKALAGNIDMINRVYNTGSMKAAAGAAVVLDVKDGSVLAASNYPSFDQNLYATQYSEYSADESLPLFNRALQGLYTRVPPSNPLWRSPRWIPGSLTAIPRSTVPGSIPTIRITAPNVHSTAMATAPLMWSTQSSGAAISSSMMWAAA